MGAFQLDYGPFRGLNNAREGNWLEPGELQTASNTQVESGALTGWEDLAGSDSSGATAISWIHLAGSTWETATEIRYSLNDANRVYATRRGQVPLVYLPDNTDRPLGVAALGGISFASITGTLSGVYLYALTFVTADGLESNKQGFDLSFNVTNVGIRFTGTTSTDNRVVTRRLWRTQAGGSIYYLLHTFTDNSTDTLDDDGSTYTLDTNTSLTWDDGGYNGSSGQYTADHSVPPVLTVLADSIHSIMGEVGVAASGMLFGAVGNRVCWSVEGYVDYWPTAATFNMPDNVEAIISSLPGFTAVFTTSAIYAFEGTAYYAMDHKRLQAQIVCKAGAGKTVKNTIHGVLFLATGGLGVFDGSSSRTWGGTLHSAFTSALVARDAAYYDRRYYLFCSSTGRISSTVTVTAGGSGYSSAPNVTFSLPETAGGRQAKGFCTLAAGAVSTVTVTDPGFGYLAAPTVTFSSGAATATTALEAGTLICDLTRGLDNADFSLSTLDIRCASVTDFKEPLMAEARRPLTWYYNGATLTAQAVDGYRGMGLATDNAANAKIWMVGGSYVDTANYGELASDEIYEYDESDRDWTIRADLPAARAKAPASYGQSGGSEFVYCYGGVSALFGSITYYSNMAVYNVTANSSSTVGAIGPGERSLVAQAMNNTTASAGVLYVMGGTNSGGDVQSTVHSYSGGTGGSWTSRTAMGTALCAAAACWVPGGVAGNTNGIVIVFGGSTATSGTPPGPTAASGINTIQVLNLDDHTWTSNTTPDTAGVPARNSAVMVYDAATQLVFLHGGTGTDGSYLSDLWVLDPTNLATTAPAAADWVDHVDYVGSLGERTQHAAVIANGRMYIFGGRNNLDVTNKDLWRIPVLALDDYGSTPGLYAVKTNDNGQVRRWGGGAKLAWTAKMGDILGKRWSARKSLLRGWIDYEGAVTLSGINENGAAVTAKSLSSNTRTQAAFWFPRSAAAAVRGSRLALQLAGSAASGARPVGKVWTLSVLGRQDDSPAAR